MKNLTYTRTGDEGKTSLIGGLRVAKYDDRVEAYALSILQCHGLGLALLVVEEGQADLVTRTFVEHDFLKF